MLGLLLHLPGAQLGLRALQRGLLLPRAEPGFLLGGAERLLKPEFADISFLLGSRKPRLLLGVRLAECGIEALIFDAGINLGIGEVLLLF